MRYLEKHTILLKAVSASFPLLSEIGSATFCMGKMDSEGIFRVANIGDSGFMIIRDGMILIESAEHQHEFNYPFQLGIGKDGKPHKNDRPEDAQVYRVQLEKGDIIVMGTDGLLDNVWPKQILTHIDTHPLNPKDLSKELATIAYEESQMKNNFVPFFKEPKKRKYLTPHIKAEKRMIFQSSFQSWIRHLSNLTRKSGHKL